MTSERADYVESKGLVDAPLIDEKTVFITYMAIHSNNPKDQLLERLESWLSDAFILSVTKEPLNQYVYEVEENIKGNIRLLEVRRFDQIDESLVRQHPAVISFVHIIMKPVLATLPSPSYLITRSLNTGDEKTMMGINIVLNELLLPYLLHNGPEERLFVYRDDLDALTQELSNKRQLKLRHSYLRRYLIIRTLLHGSFDLVDRLFEGDWNEVAGLMISPIEAEDPYIYRKVVELQNYHPNYLIAGHLSMEPDECVRSTCIHRIQNRLV